MQQTILPWYRPMTILSLHCRRRIVCCAMSACQSTASTTATQQCARSRAAASGTRIRSRRCRCRCLHQRQRRRIVVAPVAAHDAPALALACAALLRTTTSAHTLAEHIMTSNSCGEHREGHIVDELSRAAAHDSGVRCHGCRIFVVTHLRLALLVTSPL